MDSVAVGDTEGEVEVSEVSRVVEVAGGGGDDEGPTVSVDVAVTVAVDCRPSVIVKSGSVSSDFPLPFPTGGSGGEGGGGSSASSSFFRKKLGGSLYLPLPLPMRRRNPRSRMVRLVSMSP
jgi:hypothetical protein